MEELIYICTRKFTPENSQIFTNTDKTATPVGMTMSGDF